MCGAQEVKLLRGNGMKVQIIETGKVEKLVIIDRKTGVNWAADLLGNTDAYSSEQWGWNAEDEIRTCTQSEYDWWIGYIAAYEQAQEKYHDLRERFDADAVDDCYRVACGGVEFSGLPAAIMNAMNEFEFGEKAAD